MNPDWFIPHVLDKIGTRRTITWGMTDFTGTYGWDLIEDFGRRESLLMRNLKPDRVEITMDGGDALLTYKGDLLPLIPGATFLDESFIT